MKRLLLLFCLIFMEGNMLMAQKPVYNQDEISVGVGTATLHEVYDVIKKVGTTAMSLGGYMVDSVKYSASTNANYFHYINKTVAIGMIFCYQTSRNKDTSAWTHKYDRNLRDKYYSIVPAVKVNFVTKDIWRLYCKGGIGVTLDRRTCTDDNTHSTYTRLTMQCSFGFEYGKTVCAFTELGEGAEGTIQAGIRMRFR